LNKIYLLLLFIVLNFGGLALGNMFMGDAVNGKWYINLNKAPWTPPGWVFGVAWTTIMICFSIYLSYLFSIRNSRYVLAIYCLAFILNVSWNYFFFNQHFTSVALFVLIFLLLVIIYFFISFGDEELSKMKYLLVPYIIWLCIAISLNGYVVLKN
jgi:translocator protein